MRLLQNVMTADWAPLLLVLGLTPTMRQGVVRAGGRTGAVRAGSRTLALLTRLRIALPVTGEQAVVFLAAICAMVLRLPKDEEARERDLGDDLRRRGLEGTSGEAGPRSSR